MSDTPRTDEAVGQTDYGRIGYVWASFARQLERENSDLRAAHELVERAHENRIEKDMKIIDDLRAQLSTRDAEIAAMRPMIDACKARYERHNIYERHKQDRSDDCECLTCQWYRDYESKLPKD